MNTNVKSGKESAPIVVGIGTSAGGLAALELFFTHTPKHCGLAFVVIQHLHPSYPSLLPEILQRFTTMRVQTASDGANIEAEIVYLIPPGKYLRIHDGALRLSESERPYRQWLPIDVFFFL